MNVGEELDRLEKLLELLGKRRSRRALDEVVDRAARGVAAVNRATARARRVADGDAPAPVYRVPATAALELGWIICPACGRGIDRGGCVVWRGERLHPECVAERLAAA